LFLFLFDCLLTMSDTESEDTAPPAVTGAEEYYPKLQWHLYPLMVPAQNGKKYILVLPDQQLGCGLCRMPYGASVSSLAKHWREECLYYHAFIAARRVQKESKDKKFKLEPGFENATGGLFRDTFLRGSSPIVVGRNPPPRPPRKSAAKKKAAVYPTCLLGDLVKPCSRSERAALPAPSHVEDAASPVSGTGTRKKSASSVGMSTGSPRTGTVAAVSRAGTVPCTGTVVRKTSARTSPTGTLAAMSTGFTLVTDVPEKALVKKPPPKRRTGTTVKKPASKKKGFDEDDKDFFRRFEDFVDSPAFQIPQESYTFNNESSFKRDRIDFLRTVAGRFFTSRRMLLGRSCEFLRILCGVALAKLSK
jgi:hypothetical protein